MDSLFDDFFSTPDTFDDDMQTDDPVCLDTLLHPANVKAAWQRVRRNQGCAGVDGVSIADLEPVFDQQWHQVQLALRSSEYRPRPLLRIRIPKPQGGERLLGIPTVLDRVVQQALAQVMSPCWDPRFSARSFAYRPGRGPHDAMEAVERALNRGATCVLHVDIENFFDSVPHPVALSSLGDGLSDKRLITLIQNTLSCGVYENGLVRPTTIGLAQGSPLSPLLANIVLHHLDTRLESAGWDFVRYADDCVVLLAREELAASARQMVTQSLAALGLRLNERKTLISRPAEARFLGFAFRSDPCGRVSRTVSPESLAAATETLLRIVQTAGDDPECVSKQAAAMRRTPTFGPLSAGNKMESAGLL